MYISHVYVYGYIYIYTHTHNNNTFLGLRIEDFPWKLYFYKHSGDNVLQTHHWCPPLTPTREGEGGLMGRAMMSSVTMDTHGSMVGPTLELLWSD